MKLSKLKTKSRYIILSTVLFHKNFFHSGTKALFTTAKFSCYFNGINPSLLLLRDVVHLRNIFHPLYTLIDCCCFSLLLTTSILRKQLHH